MDERITHDRPILLSIVLFAIAAIVFRNVLSFESSKYVAAFFGICILPNIVCGSQTSFLQGTKSSIKGKYLPEFRGVYEEFRKNVRSGIERGAQVVVMFKGVVAVDLYTRLESNDTYDAKSTQNVWSSTKTVSSLAMAMLVDRKKISYDEKISNVWPEFGTNGKEDITVADLLRHEAGLYEFDETLSMDVLRDPNKMAREIERQTPKDLGQRKYHAITRGWILSEIVRRVDGRTMGEFVRDEIAKPLRLSTFSIGQRRDDVSSLVATSIWWTWCQLLIPLETMGRRIHIGAPLYLLLSVMPLFFGKKEKDAFELPIKKRVFERPMSQHAKSYSTSTVREVEIPSANGQGNARALAEMANAIVSPLHGRKSPLFNDAESSKKAHENPIEKDMFFEGMKTSFTNAGWCRFGDGSENPFDRFGFTGWMGYGGSVMQWHTDLDIAFGYVMDLMESDLDNRRAFRLQGASFECASDCVRAL